MRIAFSPWLLVSTFAVALGGCGAGADTGNSSDEATTGTDGQGTTVSTGAGSGSGGARSTSATSATSATTATSGGPASTGPGGPTTTGTGGAVATGSTTVATTTDGSGAGGAATTSGTGGAPTTSGSGAGGSATSTTAASSTAASSTAASSTAASSTAASSTAASSSASTGTGGGPSPCAVEPVSPNATAQAKNLLCYLYSIKGNHVLSGQQEANWNANPADIAWYTSNGMKVPAILGSDFLYRDGNSCTAVTSSTNRAIAQWKAGGITMFRYHMGMPGAGLTCTADCYMGANCAEPSTKPTAAFFTNVVTKGTAENTSLNVKLDYVAVQISAMKAANVPVILALFHETQPNGWFWWAETASGPSFISLWKYAFNYLTVTKGLNNIVWLMPFSGSPSAAFSPGKAFLDIGGPDEYTKPGNLLTFNSSGNYNPATNALGTTIPIALHETGAALQPNSMFPNSTAPWIMWNVWAGYEMNTGYNTVASMQAAYGSQYTITRDEVPNLK